MPDIVQVSTQSNTIYDQVSEQSEVGTVNDTSTTTSSDKTSTQTRVGNNNQTGNRTTNGTESSTRSEISVGTTQNISVGSGTRSGINEQIQIGSTDSQSQRESVTARNLSSTQTGTDTNVQKVNIGFSLSFTIKLRGGTGTDLGGC